MSKVKATKKNKTTVNHYRSAELTPEQIEEIIRRQLGEKKKKK
jgi:hypothetical protein